MSFNFIFVQSYFVLCCIVSRSPTNLNPCVSVTRVVGEVEHKGRVMVGETLTLLENGGACAVADVVADVTTTSDWS